MAPIEVEFEKWCSRMIIMAKNRYAGMVTWSDGNTHEPKSYFKGIELKQSRMPPVMKNVMSDVIEGILSGKEVNDIEDSVCIIIRNVVDETIEPIDVCMKGKLDRDLSKYKVLSGPSAGADWANKHIGKNYREGSYFLVTLNNQGKYVAFDDPSEIDGIENIGYRLMAERFIIKKIEPYFNIMNWSMRKINNTLNGITLTEWL
jgi:DNA polymerase elongation subunit (family B)